MVFPAPLVTNRRGKRLEVSPGRNRKVCSGRGRCTRISARKTWRCKPAIRILRIPSPKCRQGKKKSKVRKSFAATSLLSKITHLSHLHLFRFRFVCFFYFLFVRPPSPPHRPTEDIARSPCTHNHSQGSCPDPSTLAVGNAFPWCPRGIYPR